MSFKIKVVTLSTIMMLIMVFSAAYVFAQSETQHTEKKLRAGDVNVIPLEVNGNAKDRLNLVIFGDGYTADEMDKFRQDVDRNLNVMWASEPFRSYRNYFNLYMVETPSKDSGISCDPDDGNVRRDTAFNLQFAAKCPAEELARGITFGSGGDKARQQIMEDFVAPELGISASAQNVQSLTLANTFTYGGIGGVTATTSGGSPQGPLVSLHELGHSLGNLQDEYPYYDRDVPGSPYSGKEPNSNHHTLMSSKEMIANKAKWWRWLGEESLSGGIIRAADPDGHESGLYNNSKIWRPSEHSKMRAIGFYFDQIGREQMTQRITGMRNAGEMPLFSTPEGEVGSDDVVWLETMQPRFHELDVNWKVNGKNLKDMDNSRTLKLADVGVQSGDKITATVKDRTEFVRDTSLLEGPRMTQTREWVVGTPIEEKEVDPKITSHSPNERALAHDEVPYIETTHPARHAWDVTWKLNGKKVPGAQNSLSLNLGDQKLPKGISKLSVTVADSAGTSSDTVSWDVDNHLPTADRILSEPLTTLPDDVEHNVYFNAFDMQLKPKDDQPGFVVGEFRLDHDGWYNYYGFPEEPLEAPFHFSHSGTEIKGITYGNLGTGGLTKTAFEQSYTENDPGGPFIPGFGTHTVEHRAIDAAGNIGEAASFKATVLPGEPLKCTSIITGKHDAIDVKNGVTCIDNAQISGDVTVHSGASLMVSDSTINGQLRSDGAKEVELFGTTVSGQTRIVHTESNVTLAGNKFSALTLIENTQISANQQFGEYGPIVAGNAISGPLACDGNSAAIKDFGAKNNVDGAMSGGCADKDISTASIKKLIGQFEENGDFSGGSVIHSLTLHLTSVAHYEKKKSAEKVIKHMEGFKKLLDKQKDQISEVAYDNLKADANAMIRSWQ